MAFWPAVTEIVSSVDCSATEKKTVQMDLTKTHAVSVTCSHFSKIKSQNERLVYYKLNIFLERSFEKVIARTNWQTWNITFQLRLLTNDARNAKQIILSKHRQFSLKGRSINNNFNFPFRHRLMHNFVLPVWCTDAVNFFGEFFLFCSSVRYLKISRCFPNRMIEYLKAPAAVCESKSLKIRRESINRIDEGCCFRLFNSFLLHLAFTVVDNLIFCTSLHDEPYSKVNLVWTEARLFIWFFHFADAESDPNRAPPCDPAVCVLPDCFCSEDGTTIPGDVPAKDVPQMITITFDDAINNNNIDLYREMFNGKRKNPNGCDIKATVSIDEEPMSCIVNC